MEALTFALLPEKVTNPICLEEPLVIIKHKRNLFPSNNLKPLEDGIILANPPTLRFHQQSDKSTLFFNLSPALTGEKVFSALLIKLGIVERCQY